MRRRIAILLAIATLIGGTALGWSDAAQHKSNAMRGGGQASVVLLKYTKDADGNRIEPLLLSAVTGAEFELYREGEDEPLYKAATDEAGHILLPFRLEPGEYYFAEPAPPDGYDYDRDELDSQIERYRFTVTGDAAERGSLIQIPAFNRLGKLTVEKTVVNADGSQLTREQLEKEFRFKVTFTDGKTYPFTITGTALALESATEPEIQKPEIPQQEVTTDESDPEPDPGPAPEPETATEPEQETETEPVVSAEAEAEENAADVPSPDNTTEAEVEAVVEEEQTTEPEPTVESATEPEPEGEPEPEMKPMADPEPPPSEPPQNDPPTQTEDFDFVLRHGQKAVFSTVPIGVDYKIEEVDLPEGYYTTAPERNGKIPTYAENPDGATERYINIHGDETDTQYTYLYIVKRVQNNTGFDVSNAEFTIQVLIDGKPQTLVIKGGQTYGPIAVPEGAEIEVRETNLPMYFELVSISEPVADNSTGDLYVTVSNRYNPPVQPTPPPTIPPTIPPTETPTPTPTPTETPTPTPTETPTETPPPTETPEETPTPLPPPRPGEPNGPDDEDYFDIGDDDAPTGSWVWDEETGEWIFVPNEPPRTGDAGIVGWIIAFVAALALGVLILSPPRKRGGK
jgi:hypothetical protein